MKPAPPVTKINEEGGWLMEDIQFTNLQEHRTSNIERPTSNGRSGEH
jgi:hypothetical protein